ncbi:WRKY domain-containing protein [Heracleum sosnowskyi]|uniref:WRKY domain-containing protein n=1 Tax=Heracleum sosnowskyi TaxID=360622 RepID=A0AAD8MT29_9APIA|nr:WRKY domain-containing protein [Heracleum sosnowskyi]
MAVDLINFQKMLNHSLLNESAGSEEMNNIQQQLIRILQSHNHQISTHPVTKKTGHARFRRAPLDTSTSSVQSEPVKPVEPVNPVEVKLNTNFVELNKKTVEESKDINSGNSSGMSSVTGEEGTVSNGKPLFSTPAPRTFSSGKPPLPTSHRKRAREIQVSQGLFGKASSSRGCHCCKRRKTVIKREIKRVTTSGSSKVGADDIPADKYSWKKYDQKLIPGTLFPRGYYKCNSAQGCPARKHVERDSKDPTVLILIYEGEHRHHHNHSSRHRWNKMPESLTRVNNNTSGVGICC